MDITSLALVALIGVVFWGGWPLVAQASDISDPFVRGFLLNAVTTIGFLPFLPGRISSATLVSTGAKYMLIAGCLNLAGHMLFPKLQTAAGTQISLYMTLMPALVIVTNAIGGPIFFGDPVTGPKIAFTAFIVIGVVGLAFTSLK
ncbi:MAG: hypothetical protein AAB605_00650 [Patescibacteria group bacterium]